MTVIIEKEIDRGKAVAVIIFKLFGKYRVPFFEQIYYVKREIISFQLLVQLIDLCIIDTLYSEFPAKKILLKFLKILFSALPPSKMKRWRALSSDMECT